MRKSRSYRVSLALMGGSLLLLLLLEGFWLRQVYKEKTAQLQRETNHVFVTAVRDVTDSLMERHIQFAYFSLTDSGSGTRIFIQSDSGSTNSGRMGRAGKMPVITFDSTDSIQSVSVWKERRRAVFQATPPDGPGTSPPDFQPNIFPGAMSVYLGSFPGKDSGLTEAMDTLIRVQLNRLTPAAPIPEGYRLVIRHDSLRPPPPPPLAPSAITTQYIDVPSQTRVIMVLDQYVGFLLAKMIPEIAFSVFLTAIVALAFGFMAASLRQQMRINALKDDFIHNVTHELKTPISTVRVVLEALENYRVLDEPARTREYVRIAQTEVERLSGMVERVLNLSLMESGGLQFEFQPTDLTELARQAVAAFQPLAEKAGGHITLHSPETPALLPADALHLSGLLYNLLDNALKYSPDAPDVSVTLTGKPGVWTLAVCDRGIGIAPAFHKKVFEKFFRMPAGNTHAVKGYGLGLSYVAAVAAAHGAVVEVHSRKSGGSCFTISFPVSQS